MALVLDAGALIAIERRDRETLALVKREWLEGRVPITHGAIVGQVWRHPSRQVPLARLFGALDVRAIDLALGRRAGVLLGRARRADIVDAALVLLAQDGDRILTSDPRDLAALAAAADLHVELTRL